MNFIRLITPLIILIASLSFGQTGVPHVDFPNLDAYIAKSMKNWNIPGLAIAIVKDDSVVFAKGFGVRTMGTHDSVDTHTLFAIASLSKAFTTASLGLLVDQKKLNWDDRVTDYVPYFQLYDPYATREMRVRDLLCHRSGLHTFGGDLIWYGTTYDRKEIIHRIRHLKPRYSFRATYGYQNIMLLTAGEIIPAITGRQWDDCIRDSIFVPLGMTETNTSVRAFEGQSDVATPHTTYHGALITIPYRNVDNVASAAAINSSVNDLAKWMRFWLRPPDTNGVGVLHLSSATRYELWTPQTIIPISQRATKINPSRHFSTAALGWFAFDYLGRKIMNHGGGMDGMISNITLAPEERLGVVILTNSINSLPPAIAYRVLDQYLGAPERDWSTENLERMKAADSSMKAAQKKEAGERAKSSKPSLTPGEYAGTYRSEMYGDVRVAEEDGKLVVFFVPTPSFVGDLTHWQYNTFTIDLRDHTLPTGKVTFEVDASGKCSDMKINIPNPDFDFTELELKRVESAH